MGLENWLDLCMHLIAIGYYVILPVQQSGSDTVALVPSPQDKPSHTAFVITSEWYGLF